MSETSLESIMQCSKEAIARAYMCRDYYENMKECPAVTPIRCYLGHFCGDITPQEWEEVLNSAQEKKDEDRTS